MSELVTSGAVTLTLRPASTFSRTLSFLIDMVVSMVFAFGGIILLGSGITIGLLDTSASAPALLLNTLFALIILPAIIEYLSKGKSLGRLIMGTRVIREDGSAVLFRQSLLRQIIGMLEIWSTSGAIALLLSIIDKKSRRLGDMAAGTFVLQERVPERHPQRLQIPETFTTWAKGADIGRIPAELTLAITQYLQQRTRLNPTSRETLGRELTLDTLQYVSPAPPAGFSAEEFLEAVIAERALRDEQQYRRQETHRQQVRERVLR